MFFNQKNEWNQDVKSNFETSEFWVVPIPKFALVRIIVHQLKNLNLKICMVFTQEFEFCFQIFIPMVLRNLIFETSEAPLSSIWKNWLKWFFFHEYLPKGLTNFECSELKLYTLNYHNSHERSLPLRNWTEKRVIFSNTRVSGGKGIGISFLKNVRPFP